MPAVDLIYQYYERTIEDDTTEDLEPSEARRAHRAMYPFVFGLKKVRVDVPVSFEFRNRALAFVTMRADPETAREKIEAAASDYRHTRKYPYKTLFGNAFSSRPGFEERMKRVRKRLQAFDQRQLANVRSV